MAGDSLLFGDCRSVTHLESGEQIWADDDVHSLLVTFFVFLLLLRWANNRIFIDQANCNEIELDLEDESNRTYLGKNTPMEDQ